MAQIKLNATYGLTGTLPAVSGANLTTLNGTQVTSGTLPMARLSGTLPALNGSALTTLNATNVSSGTLNAARYSGGKLVGYEHSTYSTETATNSGSMVATGLTVNYTPTSTSNTLLVYVTHGQFYVNGASTSLRMELHRDGSNVKRIGYALGHTDSAHHGNGTSLVFEDTIANTNQKTYATFFYMDAGGGYVYSQINDTTSSITVMEIS